MFKLFKKIDAINIFFRYTKVMSNVILMLWTLYLYVIVDSRKLKLLGKQAHNIKMHLDLETELKLKQNNCREKKRGLKDRTGRKPSFDTLLSCHGYVKHA